ncbi:DUF3290 family protein [Enterococcus bulliens]
MTFYTYDYLINQPNDTVWIRYGLLFSLLFILAIVFGLYLRHRWTSKYRDLSLIVLLLILLTSGIQFSEYQETQTKHSPSTQTEKMLQTIAKQKQVSLADIVLNDTQLCNGSYLKIKEAIYLVEFTND